VLTVLVRAPVFVVLLDAEFMTPRNENAVLSTFAAALIPVAFLVAWVGVSRARCGESPDWLRLVRSIRWTDSSRRERSPFASAMRAQVWYEWRLRGLGFVITVICILALLLALAVVLER